MLVGSSGKQTPRVRGALGEMLVTERGGEQGQAKQAFRVWAGLCLRKEKGKGGEAGRRRLRPWCSSEEASARPEGLTIAQS